MVFTPGSIVQKYSSQQADKATGGFVPGSIVSKYSGQQTVTPETDTFADWTGIQNKNTYFKDSWNQLVETVKHPIKAIGGAFSSGIQTIPETLTHAKTDIGEAFKTEGDNWAKNTADVMSALGASASVLFLPMTAVFSAAEKLPVLKQGADVINSVFTAAGKIGAFPAGKFVDVLPIDQDDKDILKPAFEEIGTLAGQILLGGKVMGKLSKGVKKLGKEEVVKLKNEAITESKAAEQTVLKNKPELKEQVVEKAKPAPESPLAQEATKYKSAEEFVKEQKFVEAPKLNWDTIPEEGIQAEIPLNKLRVDSKALDRATKNTIKGNGSRTSGDIDVVMLKDGTFAINEGHHRAVQKVLQKDKNIRARIYSSKDYLDSQVRDWENLDTTFSQEKSLTKSQLTDIFNQAVKTAPEVKIGEGVKIINNNTGETRIGIVKRVDLKDSKNKRGDLNPAGIEAYLDDPYLFGAKSSFKDNTIIPYELTPQDLAKIKREMHPSDKKSFEKTTSQPTPTTPISESKIAEGVKILEQDPTFTKGNHAEYTRVFLETLNKDPNLALDIALGKKEAPKGGTQASFAKLMGNIEFNPNLTVEQIMRLTEKPVVASLAGQELESAKLGNGELGIVDAIKQINKVRKENLGKIDMKERVINTIKKFQC